jgi:hypothetical protein
MTILMQIKMQMLIKILLIIHVIKIKTCIGMEEAWLKSEKISFLTIM